MMIKSVNIDLERGLTTVNMGIEGRSDYVSYEYYMKDFSIDMRKDMRIGELDTTKLEIKSLLAQKPLKVVR